MSGLRILVLGSYPTASPRHGGQIRLGQIVAAYRARGHHVIQASYFPASPYYMSAPRAPSDVALPTERLQQWRGHRAPFIEDLASGELAAADDKQVQALEAQAGACDVVHLEQPWLLPVVERLRERGRLGPFRLVYGSQNIERRLKAAIFRQYRVAGGEPVLEGIEALERRAAAEAALVAAVTRDDAAQLQPWTAAPVVLAANGVQPWRASAAALARWRAKLGSARFALYVASAHPPNVVGFTESFGECLAALSPLQQVVIAGSVAEHIVGSPWFRSWLALNQRRVVAAGEVSEDDLSALRELAHAFVVPITAGEGSNLKTAEAAYSGKWVVATPRAMRGFERCASLPQVLVREPGAAFGQAVSACLDRPAPPTSPEQDAVRESLTWSATLAALCEGVDRMVSAG